MSSNKHLQAALLACAALTAATTSHAHQVWLENTGGQARLHFGEFNDNLRETSPGALDKFKGEQRTRLERATCQQPALLQRIREHGIRVAHDYDGSDGKPLASIEIDPQKLQCQG